VEDEVGHWPQRRHRARMVRLTGRFEVTAYMIFSLVKLAGALHLSAQRSKCPPEMAKHDAGAFRDSS
jgi:hypothetical protein